jgi:hypothetical protein
MIMIINMGIHLYLKSKTLRKKECVWVGSSTLNHKPSSYPNTMEQEQWWDYIFSLCGDIVARLVKKLKN